ncbi:hypothetical protein MRX96_025568 [Rhipicephalus microplus]
MTGGVFTGKYDDSVSVIRTKGAGAKTNKDLGTTHGKIASAPDPQPFSRTEGAPVPKTQKDGAAAPPDGKADNFEVVAGTLASKGTASQQWYGRNAPPTMTGTSHGSKEEKPFSTSTACAESAGAAFDLESGAPLGEKSVNGVAAASAGFPPPAVKVLPKVESSASLGDVFKDRGSVPSPKAVSEHRETSQPVPAPQTGAGKPGSANGRPSAALNVTFVTERNTKQECFLYGSMICVTAVICSVLVAILITAFFPNRALTPLACVTPECIAARDYLAGLINFSRDACGDFYGYVCDSWIAHRKHGGSFRGDSVAASLASINGSLWRKNDAEARIKAVGHVQADTVPDQLFGEPWYAVFRMRDCSATSSDALIAGGPGDPVPKAHENRDRCCGLCSPVETSK